MAMKRIYIKPNITVVKTSVESLLVGDSQGQMIEGHSKEHNSFWDSWSEEIEEEKPMFQQPKSLWD